jgi:hypothetical protein
VTGKVPYFDLAEQVIAMAKYRFTTPTIPESLTVQSELHDFCVECWDQSPILRPTSERVVEFLTDFANKSASSIHGDSSSDEEVAEQVRRDKVHEQRNGGISSRRSAVLSPALSSIPRLDARVPSRQDGRLSRAGTREHYHSEYNDPDENSKFPFFTIRRHSLLNDSSPGTYTTGSLT